MPGRDITELLDKLQDGDAKALEQLFPIVYDELREIAHRELGRERAGHTMNTTALVHEVYLKMVNYPPSVDWNGKDHFFAVASRAMRQILVSYAKARASQKRGGNVPKLQFDEEVFLLSVRSDHLIALEEALQRLEEFDERQVRVVECRYFTGLTIEETANALGVSQATVNRDWVTARLWLNREVEAILAGKS